MKRQRCQAPVWNCRHRRQRCTPPATLVAGLENGTLRPVIGKEFPLAEAAQALRAMMEPGRAWENRAAAG